MPLYEYACTDCDHRFEKRMSFELASEPQDCPKCGNETKKLISHFSAFNSLGSSIRGIKGASGNAGPYNRPGAYQSIPTFRSNFVLSIILGVKVMEVCK